MSEDTLKYFESFNSKLTSTVNILRCQLQQTNNLNGANLMYSEQFNKIQSFLDDNNAFVAFLKEEVEGQQRRYAKFKLKFSNSPIHKQRQSSTSSSISIQSSIPQSENEWSYPSNTDQPIWRNSMSLANAFESNTNTDNEYIEKSVYSHPLIICDSDDVNSDITSFLPSVPDECHRYFADADDEKQDGDGNEMDLLIPNKIQASFTGFFRAAPNNLIEFKRDDITKPKENKPNTGNIRNGLELSPFVNTNFVAIAPQSAHHHHTAECKCDRQCVSFNDFEKNKNGDERLRIIPGMKARQSIHIRHDNDIAATNEMSMSENAKNKFAIPDNDNCDDIKCEYGDVIASVKLKEENGPNASKDNSMNRPLMSKRVTFRDEPLIPLTFIKPNCVNVQNALYPNAEKHPHYHPLVHAEGAEDRQNETQVIDGEAEEEEKAAEEEKERRILQKDKYMNACMIKTLKRSMDRNHSDLKDIKRALYSLSKRKIVINDGRKQWNLKKKKKQFK